MLQLLLLNKQYSESSLFVYIFGKGSLTIQKLVNLDQIFVIGKEGATCLARLLQLVAHLLHQLDALLVAGQRVGVVTHSLHM